MHVPLVITDEILDEDISCDEVNGIVDIRAKQNKAGKPVCTRDGRKARIISFDRKFLFKNVSYPIIALVEDAAKEETIYGYNEKGKTLIENDTPYKDDLMMLPQKKEGWVRIYKSASNVYYLSSNIYKTEEEAKHSSDCCYVGASKISWEE